MVFNCEARFKELDAFNKQLDKEEEKLREKTEKLAKKIYSTQSETYAILNKLRKLHSHFDFERHVSGNFKIGTTGRPRSASGYRLRISFWRNDQTIEKVKNSKGKFIVATNVQAKLLGAREVIENYRGRTSNIEGCYKFLKSRAFKLNQIFLKRVDRIESLLAIMSLCLFVNNLAQMEIKNKLIEKKESVPNQVGKPIQNPTMKWVFQLMRKVVKVKVNLKDNIFEEFKGIEAIQTKIINCFGHFAQNIYGFP